MAPRPSNSIILILSIILVSATNISGFNITRLLSQYSEFSTYNDLLTQTGVATSINNRNSLTILVVDNSGMGPISGKPQSTVKNILATHVLLDYFDTNKLNDLTKSILTTNLFQSSGVAYGQQGQINITINNGEIVFGSAMHGAPHASKLVKSVAAQPYNIAVLQISQPIDTPGLDQTAPTAPSSSPKPAPQTPPQAPPPKQAEAPKAKTPAPAEGPAADDDTVADAPGSEGPAASSPTLGPSPNLAPDENVADDEPKAKLAPPSNAGSRVSVGGAMIAAFMGLIALAH